MLKLFLRSVFFTYISFYVVNSLLNVLTLDIREYAVFILGLSIFNMSVKPVLNLVGLPSTGVSLFVIKSVLIFVLLMLFVSFVPNFFIKASTISGIMVFGYLVPDLYLTNIWSTVAMALLSTSLFGFFDWMCHTSGK